MLAGAGEDQAFRARVAVHHRGSEDGGQIAELVDGDAFTARRDQARPKSWPLGALLTCQQLKRARVALDDLRVDGTQLRNDLCHRATGIEYLDSRRPSRTAGPIERDHACTREGSGPDDARLAEPYRCNATDMRLPGQRGRVPQVGSVRHGDRLGIGDEHAGLPGRPELRHTKYRSKKRAPTFAGSTRNASTSSRRIRRPVSQASKRSITSGLRVGGRSVRVTGPSGTSRRVGTGRRTGMGDEGIEPRLATSLTTHARFAFGPPQIRRDPKDGRYVVHGPPRPRFGRGRPTSMSG